MTVVAALTPTGAASGILIFGDTGTITFFAFVQSSAFLSSVLIALD
jgi:hypothetical protein